MLRTLEPLDEGRKCFRLVGGVLVEQTVGTTRPTVQGNLDNLKLVRHAITGNPCNPGDAVVVSATCCIMSIL